MNNKISKKMNKTVLVVLGLTLGAFVSSCGGDEGEVTPSRTVNKALLTDKDWNRNGSTWFVFHADGKYNREGTWKWLNNSDSMEVINSRSVRSVLYFDYIVANEMKCGSSVGDRAVYTSP